MILFLLIPICLNAQNKRAAIWYVGNKKIDFNSKPSVVTDVADPFMGIRSSLALADENGLLLLFASGVTKMLYNKDGLMLKNGDSIQLNNGSTHSSIFIPKPYDPNVVYFICDDRYSLIDVKNDSVLIKNSLFTSDESPTVGPIFAVHHRNCNDVWLLRQQDSILQLYLVSQNGIRKTKDYNFHKVVLSGTLSLMSNFFCFPVSDSDSTVSMKFGIFDRSTGNFNEKLNYTYLNYNRCYGVTFSPDETKLYYMLGGGDKVTYYVFQVAIIDGMPDFAHPVLINTQRNQGVVPVSTMQLGLDGKVYHIFSMKRKINIIHNPNESGNGCDYEDNAIVLNTVNNNAPTFISDWFLLNPCPLYWETNNSCLFSTNYFKIYNLDNADSISWDFGDGNISSVREPVHVYLSPGRYTVSLNVKYRDGSIKTLSKQVVIHPQVSALKINHD